MREDARPSTAKENPSPGTPLLRVSITDTRL
ncbi:hypothetical protein D4764_20G0005460 [Takifugu flavidus]|uniref:Uncharacterized protein n=1 Tax=Takifugu flavidus TaxID=433684 RepID=A0A5C6NG76_9TELE|nr:hypothetical protein D4764_20G0005460 [Takifugu flavidus]